MGGGRYPENYLGGLLSVMTSAVLSICDEKPTPIFYYQTPNALSGTTHSLQVFKIGAWLW